ncbi:unnamed protein product, partial [Urochloa humidicola]
ISRAPDRSGASLAVAAFSLSPSIPPPRHLPLAVDSPTPPPPSRHAVCCCLLKEVLWFQVDLDYEFDAPRWFDLAQEELPLEAAAAQGWFVAAPSYRPLP